MELFDHRTSLNQQIHWPFLQELNIELFVKREDLLHSEVSGNKFRKLKYNLTEAKRLKHDTLLTFGGAFSNHIAATAAAGKEYNFETIGVIRGEELDDAIDENATLRFAKACGMRFKFVTRTQYRERKSPEFLKVLQYEFGSFYHLPEGGTNTLAVKGCEEILGEEDNAFDFICVAVGTGGTLSGLVNGSYDHQHILGFSVLQDPSLKEEIRTFAQNERWSLTTDYYFGGYAKISKELIHFINKIRTDTTIPLDPIYTGKMMFGVLDLVKKEYFPRNSRILAIHTGGLQGIAGMNQLLKRKKLPLLQSNSS